MGPEQLRSACRRNFLAVPLQDVADRTSRHTDLLGDEEETVLACLRQQQYDTNDVRARCHGTQLQPLFKPRTQFCNVHESKLSHMNAIHINPPMDTCTCKSHPTGVFADQPLQAGANPKCPYKVLNPITGNPLICSHLNPAGT